MAGLTPALTCGAAKLAGPWNATQACFCGLAPLAGEGASPARSRSLGAARIWLPLSSNGSSVRLALGRGGAVVRGVDMERTSREVPQIRGHEMAAFQTGLHFRLGPCPAELDLGGGRSGTWSTSDCSRSWREVAGKRRGGPKHRLAQKP